MIKISNLKHFILIGIILFQSSGLMAQDVTWNATSQESILMRSSEVLVEALEAKYYEVNYQVLEEKILNANDGDLLNIPMPNDRETSFILKLNTTMHPGLAAKFPAMKAFNIISVESRNTWGKMDIGPKGFRAMIFEPGKSTVFIDPALRGETDAYIVYRRKDYITDQEFVCGVSGNEVQDREDEASSGSRGDDYNQCELNTYDIAVATTGECAQSMGGTVESAMGEVMSSVNRLNAILEKDFSTTTTLVENNDELIFLDGTTDPYTNGDSPTLLGENQETVDEIIGPANYDIGHVYHFSPGGGGIAGLGSSCSFGQKARGTSGFNGGDPAGPFTVEIVAHEVGHQLGATHTFNNSCGGNRTDATAVEPGGGSTILSYANVCPTGPEVQNFSDDYYHGINMEQIGETVDFGCSFQSSLDNLSPEIEELPAEIIIPASTPFALTAIATDPDGDIMTYAWEQMDNEITSQPPSADAFEGPMFRSFLPTTSATRYFPSLPSAQPTTWEVLPNGSRFMNFRVSVRDNAPGGSCTQFDDIVVFVDDNAGPFIVEVPSDNGISWDPETTETVIWDVANTDDEDYEGELVDIFLSVDGGFEYLIQLADDVPNDGSHEIEVPAVAPTTGARVMVMNSGGTFFDVSDNNFEITGLAEGFELVVDDSFGICQGEDAVYNVSLNAAFDFSEQVTLSITALPPGLDATINDDTLLPGESTTLTISNTSSAPIGVSTIGLQGIAGEFSADSDLNLNVNEAVPTPLNLTSPENGAADISAIHTFTWDASQSAVTSYDLEIAFDEGFTNLYAVFTNIATPFFQVGTIPLETEFFWRVREDNGCAEAVSDSRNFTTSACQLRFSEDVPVSIPSLAGTFESELQVDQPGTIERLRLTNLVGTHGRVSDLTMSLTSPQGTVITLFSEICGSDDDFNLSFEDDGIAEIDCPPTTSLFYAPDEAFAAFNGEEASGVWTLTIVDSQNGSGGSLDGWQLDVCYEGSILSVNDAEKANVSLYPNPTSDLVQVTMDDPTRFKVLQILDMRGRLVQSRDLRNDTPMITVDLSQFDSGVYFFSFIGDGLGESMKVIKTE